MSTTPPDQPGSQQPGGYGYGRGTGPSINLSGVWPTPGNAELLVYVIALIVALIVTAAWSLVTIAAWFDFFKWATAAYLLSRGIAKASRVLER